MQMRDHGRQRRVSETHQTTPNQSRNGPDQTRPGLDEAKPDWINIRPQLNQPYQDLGWT